MNELRSSDVYNLYVTTHDNFLNMTEDNTKKQSLVGKTFCSKLLLAEEILPTILADKYEFSMRSNCSMYIRMLKNIF